MEFSKTVHSDDKIIAKLKIEDGAVVSEIVTQGLSLDEISLINSEATNLLIEYQDEQRAFEEIERIRLKKIQDAKDEEAREIKRQKLLEEKRLEEERKEKEFSDAVTNATFHFNIDRKIKHIDGRILDKSTYMAESLTLAHIAKETKRPHVLVSDFSFKRKQIRTLNNRSDGYLRLISLADTGGGSYSFSKFNDKLQDFLLKIIPLMIHSSYFISVDYNERYSSSIMMLAHDMRFTTSYPESNRDHTIYASDDRDRVEDYVYLRSSRDEFKATSLREIFYRFEILPDLEVEESRFYFKDLLPEVVFSEPYKIDIRDTILVISLKGSPYAFKLDFRRNKHGVYIAAQAGSTHVHRNNRWYDFGNLKNSYVYNADTTIHLEKLEGEIESYLEIQEYAKTFQTFTRQYGAVIRYHNQKYEIAEREAFINLLLQSDNTLKSFNIDKTNSFAYSERASLRPLSNLFIEREVNNENIRTNI